MIYLSRQQNTNYHRLCHWQLPQRPLPHQSSSMELVLGSRPLWWIKVDRRNSSWSLLSVRSSSDNSFDWTHTVFASCQRFHLHCTRCPCFFPATPIPLVHTIPSYTLYSNHYAPTDCSPFYSKTVILLRLIPVYWRKPYHFDGDDANERFVSKRYKVVLSTVVRIFIVVKIMEKPQPPVTHPKHCTSRYLTALLYLSLLSEVL